MAIARRGLTLEEFLELPEEKPALEFFDGMVTQKGAPKTKHSVLQDQLLWYLNQVVRPRRLARVFPELRTTFAGASVVPDVCLYRWERVPRDETGALENDAQTPPDLAIEIASPRQSRPSLRRRCQWYVEHGVGAALLVDDRDETIRVFRPGEAARTYRGPDRIDLDDVIPGLHIVVEEIFAALRLE